MSPEKAAELMTTHDPPQQLSFVYVNGVAYEREGDRWRRVEPQPDPLPRCDYPYPKEVSP